MNIFDTIADPTCLCVSRGIKLRWFNERYVIERFGEAVFYTQDNDLARDVFRGMVEEIAECD